MLRLRRPLRLALVLLALASSRVLAQEDARPPARPEAIAPGWLERQWAATDLAAIAAAVGAHRQENGDWPAPCPSGALARLNPAPGPDPWGTPYACRLDAPARVVSAGPDRALDTPDDVVYRLDTGLVAPAGGTVSGADVAQPPPPPATDEAKTTIDRLVWIARGLESHRAREGHYPVAEKAEYLEQWLVPTDLPASQFFAEDGWGREWRYRVTDVGSSYTLSSGGADGRWEPLVPPTARPVANADGDLVVADGRFLRWPADFAPQGVIAQAAGRPAAAAAPPAEPKDPLEATRWRLERLAEHLERARSAGRFTESDDAERTFRALGVALRPVDGWGRPVDLLTIASGSRFVLVSRGADGKASRPTEDYARGAAAAGDDILVRR